MADEVLGEGCKKGATVDRCCGIGIDAVAWPALAVSSSSVLRGADGRLSSARATLHVQDASIAIEIDQ